MSALAGTAERGALAPVVAASTAASDVATTRGRTVPAAAARSEVVRHGRTVDIRQGAVSVRVDDEGRTWIAGIGEPLPPGETVLWAGAPQRGAIARRVCHTRGLGVYFTLLAVAVYAVQYDGLNRGPATLGALSIIGMGLAVFAFAWVFASLIARSTVYAVTDRRIVLRIGVGIPAVLNVPLDRIGAVDLRRNADGTGDVVLTLDGKDRLAYLLLWPHARPWRFAQPQPALRCVADAPLVGAAIAEAVQAADAARAAEQEEADVDAALEHDEELAVALTAAGPADVVDAAGIAAGDDRAVTDRMRPRIAADAA